jgi:aminopeptidase N
VKDGMILFDQDEATVHFNNVTNRPVVSLLRNFSAPVNLEFAYNDAELAFLLQHETSGFNQWQAAQTLLENILLKDHDATVYLDAITNAKLLPELIKTDPNLASRLLDVPSESYLASRIDSNYRPEIVEVKREALLNDLAKQFGEFWKTIYLTLDPTSQTEFSQAMGIRALRNIALSMMARQGLNDVFDLAYQQYQTTDNMTERLGALRVLVWFDAPQASDALQDFYDYF